jgi:hypothetical protein
MHTFFGHSIWILCGHASLTVYTVDTILNILYGPYPDPFLAILLFDTFDTFCTFLCEYFLYHSMWILFVPFYVHYVENLFLDNNVTQANYSPESFQPYHANPTLPKVPSVL